jgi:uncharacterized membrane protein YfcA
MPSQVGDSPAGAGIAGVDGHVHLWKKDFGKLHKPVTIGRREMAVGMAIGGAIGFYDGLFGPGTGSFLIFLFIRFFAFDFLHASAAAKVVNLTTNVAALAFSFLPAMCCSSTPSRWPVSMCWVR